MIQLFVAPAIGLAVLPDAPRNHWNVCGVTPNVVMLISVPPLTARVNGPLIVAGAQLGATVTAALFTLPQAFVTRTQYCVDVDGLTMIQLPVAPAIGDAVFPDAPTNHWNVCGVAPVVVMLSSVPPLTARETGPVIVTDEHGAATDTVMVGLFALPHAFVTRTQYEVVVLGLTMIQLPVAPPIGDAVLPDVPTYHWNVCGVVPVVMMLSSRPPVTARCAVLVTAGAVHVGVLAPG